MTYPDVPLGQQFHHRRLANDLSDVDPRLSMHNAIDGPLNAGRDMLMSKPGPIFFRAAWRAVGTCAANATVPWDTTVVDTTGGAWNLGTGTFTCPLDGVYLVSAAVQLSALGLGASAIGLTGLDASIYPSTSLLSNVSQGHAFERLNLPTFPVIAKAGQVLKIAGSGVTINNQGGTLGADRSTFSIQYLGATPTQDMANTLPTYPVVGSPWSDGENINDLKLHRRFDEPMDDIRPYLDGWGSQFAMWIGSAIGGSLALGAPVSWTTMFSAGMGDQSGVVTEVDLPQRPYPPIVQDASTFTQQDSSGLWLISCSLVSGTAGESAQFLCNGAESAASTTGAGAGAGSTWSTIARLGGFPIQVNPLAAFHPVTNFRCMLAAVQLGA